MVHEWHPGACRVTPSLLRQSTKQGDCLNLSLAMEFSLRSSADLMVHTAPALPVSPLSRSIIGHNTKSQKVTKPNYLRGQRCLSPQKASWGTKLDLLKGQEYYQREREKVFYLFAWKEAESKPLGENHSISTISPKQNNYPFCPQRFAAVPCPGKCSKSKCTPILGGLASLGPPIDIWSPLPKALLASKKMYEKSAFPGAHFCSPPSTPSSSGSNGVGLPNPSQWNFQIASLIIFKGSFGAGAMTFISPPTLPFL